MLDKIKQIKYSRLKEEEKFLLSIIDGTEPFISDRYPKSIFWKKDGKVLLEQDFENGWLRLSYTLIWSVFQGKFRYSYTDAQILTTNLINNYFKNKSLRTLPEFNIDNIYIDIELKSNVKSLIHEI